MGSGGRALLGYVSSSADAMRRRTGDPRRSSAIRRTVFRASEAKSSSSCSSVCVQLVRHSRSLHCRSNVQQIPGSNLRKVFKKARAPRAQLMEYLTAR
jgi:hypothetical protein